MKIPESYVFWKYFDPTSTFHRSEQFFAFIPTGKLYGIESCILFNIKCRSGVREPSHFGKFAKQMY